MKIVIIGGGPAGLICALKSKNDSNDVTVIDKNNIMGKKINITGNGHCNFFNKEIDVKSYYSNNLEGLNQILSKVNINETYSFLQSLGIEPFEKDNLIYPMSNVAQSVSNALISACKNKNIKLINETTCLKINKDRNRYQITTNKGNIEADILVIASGSKAYPKFGSNGDCLDLIKNFDIKNKEYLPALTFLKGNENDAKKWQGIRINASLSYYEDSKYIKEESGELQLTTQGISGICVFNLSSPIIRGLNINKQEQIYINFLPKIPDFNAWFENRIQLFKDYTFIESIEQVINYKLLMVLFKESLLNKKLCNLTKEDKNYIENRLTKYVFDVSDYGDFENAQVCSGGIILTELNKESMETIKYPNMYLVGECLDVDGKCGGFNIGFAFISGYIAGKDIYGK